MSAISTMKARIEDLEKKYELKLEKEQEAKEDLEKNISQENADQLASRYLSIQAQVRSMKEAIEHKKQELEKVEEYSNSKEAKADRIRMNALLQEHRKLADEVKAGALEVKARIEKLYLSIGEYDFLAKKNGMSFDPVLGFGSLKHKREYRWIHELLIFIDQWLKNEGWLTFKIQNTKVMRPLRK